MGEKMGTWIDENHLSCYTGVVEGDKFYTVDAVYGLLLEYNMKDYSHRILMQMDCISADKGHYFVKKIIKVKEVFYFFMGNSRDIISWSLSNHEFRVFENRTQDELRYKLTENAFFSKDKIWICPAYSDQPFRCFDIISKKVTEYASIEEHMLEQGITLDGHHFIFTLVENDKLWVVIYYSPYIMSYDMIKNRWDCYSFNEFGKVSNICFDGNDLWICFMYKQVFISWTPERGITDTYEILDINFDKGDPFMHIYGAQDYIYVIPTYDNDIYIVQRKTKKVYNTGFFQNYKRINTRAFMPLFYTCLRDGSRLVLLPYSVDIIVVIDLEVGHLQYIDAGMDQNDKKFYLDHYCWDQKVMIENSGLTLKEYVPYIISRDCGDVKQEKKEVYGQAIAHQIAK